MSVSIPESALEFMNEAAPGPAHCAALSGLTAAALEALIGALERRELADHLELLGKAEALAKDTRKKAAAAAYRLRSRGVRAAGRPAPVVAREEAVEAVDLSLVALVSPPGLVGRHWLLLGGLPGVESVEVKGDADGGVEGIEVLRPVSRTKLEKLAREFDRKSVRGLPVRASADLAVRLARRWGGALPATRRPTLWAQVESWCERAVALGAEPERASARQRVKPDASAMAASALYGFEPSGIHMPSPAVLRRVLDGMRALLDQPALAVADVERKARALTRESMEAWLEVDAMRSKLALWLESTADVVWARAGEERAPRAAAALLALADTVAGSTAEALMRHPFFAEVEAALLGTARS